MARAYGSIMPLPRSQWYRESCCSAARCSVFCCDAVNGPAGVVLDEEGAPATSTSIAVIATLVPTFHTTRYCGASLAVANAALPSCRGSGIAGSTVLCFRTAARTPAADAADLQFNTLDTRAV